MTHILQISITDTVFLHSSRHLSIKSAIISCNLLCLNNSRWQYNHLTVQLSLRLEDKFIRRSTTFRCSDSISSLALEYEVSSSNLRAAAPISRKH